MINKDINRHNTHKLTLMVEEVSNELCYMHIFPNVFTAVK